MIDNSFIKTDIDTLYNNLNAAYDNVKTKHELEKRNAYLAQGTGIGLFYLIPIIILVICLIPFLFLVSSRGFVEGVFRNPVGRAISLLSIFALGLIIILNFLYRFIRRRHIREFFENSEVIRNLENESAPYLVYVPRQYRNFHAVSNFIELIKNGRAENQKELFDKYEEIAHREMMMQKQNEIVANTKRAADAAESTEAAVWLSHWRY